MILNSLNEYNFKSEFFRIVIFDFIIGNTDRHQNNWAVLQCNDNIRICPIYDNGSSLCCYIKEENIDTYLGNDKVRFNSIVNSKSKSRIRVDKNLKKESTHLEMIRYIKENYNECIIEWVKIIKDSITDIAIDNIISNYEVSLISDKRKLLIKKFLLEKVNLLTKVFLREEE